jgi:N-acetylglucosaminyldiphosphoundecaprenol N-acetyl-beta-D-mannosaminyltransferase
MSLATRDVWCIMGLPFDAVTLDNVVDEVRESTVSGKECFLSTPNLNFVMSAQTDETFFQSVVDSNVSIADGMPLIWVARLLGIPLYERVAGSTLFNQLSTELSEKKIKVFFFGGQEGIAKQAHQRLNESSLGMESCGFYDPGFVSIDDMSSVEIIDKINSARPDFVVVALGAKKGQAWIQKNNSQLTAPVISHLGAVINFVAGAVVRAPESWQGFGLEWVWRIKQEPNLWQRYFFDGAGFLKLLITKIVPLAIVDRVLKRSASFNEECYFSMQGTELKLSGSIHYTVMAPIKVYLDTIVNDFEDDVVMDCTNLGYIDSAFIATLLLFQSELNACNRKLLIHNLPKRIRLLLNLNQVLKRFSISD